MTLVEVQNLLTSAKCPEDVFGMDNPQFSFRALAKYTHPDLNQDHVNLATELFSQLQSWYSRYQQKVKDGTYGDRKPYVKLRVSWKGRSLSILSVIHSDAAFQYFQAVDDSGTESVIKLPRRPYRALVEKEKTTLKRLAPLFSIQQDYSPVTCLIDAFQFPIGGGVTLPALVLMPIRPGDMVPLTMVRNAYPAGIDPRDMAWIINKILIIVSIVNEAGITHGGLNPSNVWISPAHHLAHIGGWHFAADNGSTVKAYDPRWEDFTPPEIKNKEAVGLTTDLYSCAALASWLMGGTATHIPTTTPRAIAGLLRAALLHYPQQRPYDHAAQLLAELNEEYEKQFGPKKFRPFTLPTTSN